MKKGGVVLSTVLPRIKYIQLGLYNLKAYALKYFVPKKRVAIDIEVISTNHYYSVPGSSFPYLNDAAIFSSAKKILRKNPAIVGFSCHMWNIDPILNIVGVIKSIDPEVKIVLGGPEVSGDPEHYLKKNKNIDFIVRDEGEATFLEILNQFYTNTLNPETIDGLTYKKNNKIYSNRSRKPLDLEKIPSPYLSGLINTNEKVWFSVETSRGCPFNCAYCTFSVRGYHSLRFFPVNKVKKETLFILKNRCRYLSINDDNFNINPKRSKTILKLIKKNNIKTETSIFLNAYLWRIDKELIALLKQSRVKTMIGIQSLNKKTLSLIKRPNNFPVILDNLRLLDNYDVPYTLQFIVGLPGDTYEDIESSVDWAFSFKPIEISLFPLLVFKGTKLHQESKNLGLFFYKKPLYMVKKTRQLNRLNMKKAMNLVSFVDIFFNLGLLKKTVRFFTKTSNIQFSAIARNWQNDIKLTSIQKIKAVQKKFAESIILKYKIKIRPEELNRLLKFDLKAYFKNLG